MVFFASFNGNVPKLLGKSVESLGNPEKFDGKDNQTVKNMFRTVEKNRGAKCLYAKEPHFDGIGKKDKNKCEILPILAHGFRS